MHILIYQTQTDVADQHSHRDFLRALQGRGR